MSHSAMLAAKKRGKFREELACLQIDELYQSECQTVYRLPISQSVSYWVYQSVSRTVSESISQSVSVSICQSLN